IDWTRSHLPNLSAYHQFFLSHDWASTSLGPIKHWPLRLRQVAVTILSNPDPRLVAWGPEYITVYNEACIALLAQKHPLSLGSPAAESWKEIWDQVHPLFSRAKNHGKATKVVSFRLFVNRLESFGLEETYWSFTVSPIVGADGTAVGVLDEFTETTKSVLAERRLGTILELDDRATTASSLKVLWAILLQALERNTKDVAFALLYTVDGIESNNGISMPISDSVPTSKRCNLEGVVGITNDFPAAVSSFDLSEDTDGLSPIFRQAWMSLKPLHLPANCIIPKNSLRGIAPDRVFGEPCKSAVVCPFPPLSGAHIVGFLVLGLNAHRPYDEDYESFVQLLVARLYKSLASIFLPVVQQRSRAVAEKMALYHDSLSKELFRRGQAIEKAEQDFRHFSETAPIAFAVFQADGHPIYRNQAYYDLNGVSRDSAASGRFLSVHPEDAPFVQQQWAHLAAGQMVDPFEYRVSKSSESPRAEFSAMKGYRWMLAHPIPQLNGKGAWDKIVCWYTDITHQKYSELLQTQKLQNELESKELTKNFIDMTCHEIRNPLTAILQSAEGILETPSNAEDVQRFARTITICADHATRITEDILTLSKMDTNLMKLAPGRVRPINVVQQALNIHEAEMQRYGIKSNVVIDRSLEDLRTNTTVFDESRVLQVLINLISNAIKFTRDQPRREIIVTLSSWLNRPVLDANNVPFVPLHGPENDHMLGPEWGNGQDVFIQFSVEDTGIGMSEIEREHLSLHFSQASPKTYKKYDGSGLGMYISRKLAELQGGQIGASSKIGQGTTFTFFIKARRCEPGDSIDGSPITTIKAHRFASEDTSDGHDSPTKPKQNSGSEPSADPNPSLHILVVEDNIINQRVLAQSLRIKGHTVHVANHGGEALDFLCRSTFDSDTPLSTLTQLSVILLDLEMPVMNGLACITRIRELEGSGVITRHVPVIAVTANARPEKIQEALRNGMDAVVTKPFKVHDLVLRIKEVLKDCDRGENAGWKSATPVSV
ncbi:histidine kinase, partial [Lepidopterella palustris CBS 459.81]